jgi:hypothetical protein
MRRAVKDIVNGARNRRSRCNEATLEYFEKIVEKSYVTKGEWRNVAMHLNQA